MPTVIFFSDSLKNCTKYTPDMIKGAHNKKW